MCKLHSLNKLGKHISRILLHVNLSYLDVTLLKNLPNKVEPDVDVLRPYMIYLILCQIDSTHAISIDLQQILINPQVIE